MKMKDLHLEVLEMMERVRAKIEFWYGAREREAPRSKILRAKEGYIFLGNENYIWVPISPIPMSEHKTRVVGLLLVVEAGEVVSSCIEVVVPKSCSKLGRRDSQIANILQKILPPGVKPICDPLNYSRYYILTQNGKSTAAVLQKTELMLMKNLPGILHMLASAKTKVRPGIFIYDRNLMLTAVRKLLDIRRGMTDKTNLRLKKLYAQI